MPMTMIVAMWLQLQVPMFTKVKSVASRYSGYRRTTYQAERPVPSGMGSSMLPERSHPLTPKKTLCRLAMILLRTHFKRARLVAFEARGSRGSTLSADKAACSTRRHAVGTLRISISR